MVNLHSKKDSTDQDTIMYHTWPRILHGENNKIEINITIKSQEVSYFQTGDHKAAMNRHESMKNTRHKNTNDPQKKNRLGTVRKNIKL